MSPFEVRDVRFGIEPTTPRYWHSGRAAVSIFFNNLSTLFPSGERFFIRSVAHYRDRLEDGLLLEQVRAFTGQEAVHTREHLAFNAMLEEQGWDVEGMEEELSKLLALPELTGRSRHRVMLAITAALEHWTAMFGTLVLEEGSTVFDGVEESMAAFWRWHAAEELEHKAVALDVYRAIGGDEGLRRRVMLSVTFFFWLRIWKQQWQMMRQDGLHLDLLQWADLFHYIFIEQRLAQRAWPMWLAYFARGFHPMQFDDRAILERWRDLYAIDPVYARGRERAETNKRARRSA